MTTPASLLGDTLRVFQQELSRPQYLWQLAVIAVALVVGWFFTRWVQQRVDARVQAQTRERSRRVDLLRFSIDGFRRLAFPVSVIALLMAGGAALWGSGLVRRAAESSTSYGGITYIELGIKKGELASRLGTASETISRTFKKLKEEGIIEVQGGRVVVHQMEKLQKISERHE